VQGSNHPFIRPVDSTRRYTMTDNAVTGSNNDLTASQRKGLLYIDVLRCGLDERSALSHLVFRVAWASSSLPVLLVGQSRANKFAHATHNEP